MVGPFTRGDIKINEHISFYDMSPSVAIRLNQYLSFILTYTFLLSFIQIHLYFCNGVVKQNLRLRAVNLLRLRIKLTYKSSKGRNLLHLRAVTQMSNQNVDRNEGNDIVHNKVRIRGPWVRSLPYSKVPYFTLIALFMLERRAYVHMGEYEKIPITVTIVF